VGATAWQIIRPEIKEVGVACHHRQTGMEGRSDRGMKTHEKDKAAGGRVIGPN
jgi:hypothetical protein